LCVAAGFAAGVGVAGGVGEGLEGAGGFEVAVAPGFAAVGGGEDSAAPGFRGVGCAPAALLPGVEPLTLRHMLNMVAQVFHLFLKKSVNQCKPMEAFGFAGLNLLWIVAALLAGVVFQVIQWDLRGGDVLVVEWGRGVGLRVRLERVGGR